METNERFIKLSSRLPFDKDIQLGDDLTFLIEGKQVHRQLRQNRVRRPAGRHAERHLQTQVHSRVINAQARCGRLTLRQSSALGKIG
jgi:hypothetical protein